MFETGVLFALMQSKGREVNVKRIVLDRETQSKIGETFNAGTQELLQGKSSLVFDGRYTPNEDDNLYLKVPDFALNEKITIAIDNPIGVELYMPVEEELPRITALFIGEKTESGQYKIAFQKFKNEQYISAKKHHLFFSKDTFRKSEGVGISISQKVDCFYDGNSLLFDSYFYAKQIFDLSQYYREATAGEIRGFIDSEIIEMSMGDEFIKNANTWERKKIASINDSGLLTTYSALKIKNFAKKLDIDIEVKKGKIIIPIDTKERRILLGFLDEDVYRGVFSQELLQTNSKKKARA